MAIAFVNGADLGNNGGSTTSLTVAYTAGSGSDRLLVLCCSGTTATANNITGATYGGVAGTAFSVNHNDLNNASCRWLVGFYWLNPPTGNNNFVIASSPADWILALCAEYTGVKQSGQPDAAAKTTAASGAQNVTASVASVLDNCWHISSASAYDSTTSTNTQMIAGAGTTRRASEAAFGTTAIFDSNSAKTPAGSVSLIADYPGSDASVSGWNAFILSFAPAVAGGTSILRQMMQHNR